MEGPVLIYHIATIADWSRSGETYTPAAYAREGFVHCSTWDQLAGVAMRYYAGRSDVIVLEMSAGAFPGSLVWEDSTGSGEEFPHLYSPIARSSVLDQLSLSWAPRLGTPTTDRDNQLPIIR